MGDWVGRVTQNNRSRREEVCLQTVDLTQRTFIRWWSLCSAYTWGGNGIYVTLDPPLFTLVTEKKGRICVKGQREHVPE